MKSEGGPRALRSIAIIMDGNGRWARGRGLRRVEGHRAAETSIRESVKWCGEKGVEWLTLFAFSTENWSRPRSEVSFIMRLLSGFIQRNIDELDEERVKLLAMGRLAALPEGPGDDLRRAIGRTAGNDGLRLVLALNYGGRAEIADAAGKLASEAAQGRLDPAAIDEEAVSAALYLPGMPDPDLVIRTSGEQRFSNFMLWQAAYSELYFPEVLWPDFRREHLDQALEVYRSRQRRFGGLAPAGTR